MPKKTFQCAVPKSKPCRRTEARARCACYRKVKIQGTQIGTLHQKELQRKPYFGPVPSQGIFNNLTHVITITANARKKFGKNYDSG